MGNISDLSPTNGIVSTILEALIDHGLYELYPPFVDEEAQTKLCLRVLELRKEFKKPPETPRVAEI
jgi:hypothetical protein